MLTAEDKNWIDERIAAHIVASEQRMMAWLERIETTLLTEFHKWAQPVASRLQSHTATVDGELITPFSASLPVWSRNRRSLSDS